jgi:nucleoside-diphosphate-sugar epimerase
MNSKHIALIGGAGFVGTYLSKKLNKDLINHKIFDINTRSLENKITLVDVENLNSLDQIKGMDTIINLAAIHRDDTHPISRYDDVNVQGAINVCIAARKHDIQKIIFTSSVAIYGFAPANTNESGTPNYFNDYGRTKYLAEQVYKKWQAEDSKNRTLIIIRPTVIFGEGNRGNVFNLLEKIASKRFVMFGNGKNKKSMAYIENVVYFIKHTLSFKPGLHTYNYVDKPDFDMNSLITNARKILFNKDNVGLRLPVFLGILIGYLADIISKVTKKNLPISVIRVKKFLNTTQFQTSVNEAGFTPPFSLNEALIRTIHYEFLEDNSDKPNFKTE